MNPKSRLSETGLINLQVILQEIFGVSSLFGPLPQTVEELAERSGIDSSKVIHKLEELRKMEVEIEISPSELKASLDSNAELMLLDVRTPEEYEICHLEGSVLLWQCDFNSLKETMSSGIQVITICHHGIRSYSAAMSLRSEGINNVKSLRGGLELWAQEIDQTMPRY